MLTAISGAVKAMSWTQRAVVLLGIVAVFSGIYFLGKHDGATAQRLKYSTELNKQLIDRDRKNSTRIDDLLTAIENRNKREAEDADRERALFDRLATNTEKRLSDAIETLPTDDRACDYERPVGLGMRDAAIEANAAIGSGRDN